MARTLSLDLGDKRIGVAMSDPTGLLASPVMTIIRGNLRKDLDKIVEMVTVERHHRPTGTENPGFL
jgi:putative Holliday junction resolvase